MNKYTSDLTYEEKKYIEDDMNAIKEQIGQCEADIKAIGDMAYTSKCMIESLNDEVYNSKTELECADVKNAVPVDGTLTFTGYPDEILRTLRTLLDGRKIEMTVDWTVIDK